MMSRTDRTRPFRISKDDPYNRRFMIVASIDRFSYPFWKKLDTCSSSNCCYGWMYKYEKRKKRTAWRKERQNLMSTRMVDLKM